MIRIENLRKEYDAKTVALDDIDLVFEDSTFVALLGPSGCGKTTTLNCIAGLLEPTSGKIFFGDKDVTQLQPKDRNIGMVFQSYALYPHLKVIDNIAFPLKQKGMKKAERYEKARKIAKMLQIEYLLDRKPTQLSAGRAVARRTDEQPRRAPQDRNPRRNPPRTAGNGHHLHHRHARSGRGNGHRRQDRDSG